jgi:Tfp pilus assembly protein PilV
MQRRRRADRGLSLVEVAAAGVVISVGLVGTAAALLPAADLTQNAAETRAVTRLAGGLLEEVRATRFDLIDDTYTDLRRRISGIAGIDGATRPATAIFEVTDEPTGSARWEVRRVTVTIRWRGPRGLNTVTAGTLVCDRNADADVVE